MPLKLDTRLCFYRGPHAVHLKRHPKLGRHCTVANDVLSIVNYLVDRDDIKSIELGKVAGGKFTRRVEYVMRGNRIKFLFVGESSAQSVTVTPREITKPEQIIFAVKERWMIVKDIGGG